MAPYCAIPRDYLSDTPLLRAMGFLMSQHGQLGAIPPLPFLSASPVESMRSGGAIPPLRRGISAILARYPVKTRQMGAIPGGGGISHWAAKRTGRFGIFFVLCYPALGGLSSPDALFTRIWDTRKHPESATFSCFSPASIREFSPPKMPTCHGKRETAKPSQFCPPKLGRTPRGSCNNALLRRVLRRVLEIAFEKVLRRVLRRCLAVCFTRRQGSEKGSEKGS